VSFTIYYASKTIMKITSVSRFAEADAREWFGKVLAWHDIVRVRLVDDETKEVIADQTLEHRVSDPENPVREEAIRELAERMDRVFVADRQHVRRAAEEITQPSRRVVDTRGNELCRCGHLRVEHNGSDSTGYCHAQCMTRCQRFRMK